MNLLTMSIARATVTFRPVSSGPIKGHGRPQHPVNPSRAAKSPRPYEAAMRWLEFYGLASASSAASLSRPTVRQDRR